MSASPRPSAQFNRFVAVAVVSMLSGCVSPPEAFNGRPVSLRISLTQNVHLSGSHTVSLPVGEYKPEFQTKEGIFFKAPSALVSKNGRFPAGQLRQGGIFLPNLPETDKRSGLWMYPPEGLMIDFGPNKVRWTNGKIDFQIIDSEDTLKTR
jgi:hypothetical protein